MAQSCEMCRMECEGNEESENGIFGPIRLPEMEVGKGSTLPVETFRRHGVFLTADFMGCPNMFITNVAFRGKNFPARFSIFFLNGNFHLNCRRVSDLTSMSHLSMNSIMAAGDGHDR